MSNIDEVVSVIFFADVFLEKNEVDGEVICRPLDMEKGCLSEKKLESKNSGLAFHKFTQIFHDNIVRSGDVVKMYKSEAQPYLDAKVKKNGHKFRDVFETYPQDPLLFREHPLAEIYVEDKKEQVSA